MHLRFSTCRGIPVVEHESGEPLGTILDMLIHPDTGKIEGFFIHIPGMFTSDQLFLSAMDISHWGTCVHVRSEDVLSPVEERIRLLPLLDDKRTFLGQPIRTESGRKLGICRDIQFDTDSWHVEWLFPRTWFRWGTPLPIMEVVEVRPEAIVVRDPERPVILPAEKEVTLPEVDVPQPSVRVAHRRERV